MDLGEPTLQNAAPFLICLFVTGKHVNVVALHTDLLGAKLTIFIKCLPAIEVETFLFFSFQFSVQLLATVFLHSLQGP